MGRRESETYDLKEREQVLSSAHIRIQCRKSEMRHGSPRIITMGSGRGGAPPVLQASPQEGCADVDFMQASDRNGLILFLRSWLGRTIS